MAYADTGTTQAPTPLATEGGGSLKWWKSQITASEEKIQRYAKAWKQNIDQQTGHPLTATPTSDTVVIPIDHANIEQKKALLAFKKLSVQMIAAPGHEVHRPVLQAFSAVVSPAMTSCMTGFPVIGSLP